MLSAFPPSTPSPAGTRGSKAKKDQRLSSNSLLQMERLPHETREEDPPPQYLCLSVSFMLPSWCSTQQPKGTLPDLLWDSLCCWVWKRLKSKTPKGKETCSTSHSKLGTSWKWPHFWSFLYFWLSVLKAIVYHPARDLLEHWKSWQDFAGFRGLPLQLTKVSEGTGYSGQDTLWQWLVSWRINSTGQQTFSVTFWVTDY